MTTEISTIWPYLLVSLTIGILVGAFLMRFANPKLRRQESLQKELDAAKTELERNRQELVKHFSHSAELLDNMAQDFRNLYQHMATNSTILLPSGAERSNPFQYQTDLLEESKNSQQQLKTDEPPRDYSDKSSGLLRSEIKD